jgi:hypothetical protein
VDSHSAIHDFSCLPLALGWLNNVGFVAGSLEIMVGCFTLASERRRPHCNVWSRGFFVDFYPFF